MGTSKIRLVAVDMDGTLLNRERKITQYTQNVIRRAVSQGVVFAPATGRAVNALPQELKDMEEIRYGIFSNGATIYDLKDDKSVHQGLQYAHHSDLALYAWQQYPLRSYKDKDLSRFLQLQ